MIKVIIVATHIRIQLKITKHHSWWRNKNYYKNLLYLIMEQMEFHSSNANSRYQLTWLINLWLKQELQAKIWLEERENISKSFNNSKISMPKSL